MPDPTVDPRLAALASRAAAVRIELDRLDHLADQLEPAERAGLLPRLVAIREALDQFDTELERAVLRERGDHLPDA